MYKEETKFWHEIKAFATKNYSKLSLTRLENSAAHGTPDVLGYNSFGHFFTVELKLKKAKKISFSPHQIGFHLTHPNNSFIMLKTLGPLAIKLFEGRFIEDLIKGKAEPCATGMESSLKFLQNV